MTKHLLSVLSLGALLSPSIYANNADMMLVGSIINGSISDVNTALDEGGRVDGRYSNGNTALHIAVNALANDAALKPSGCCGGDKDLLFQLGTVALTTFIAARLGQFPMERGRNGAVTKLSAQFDELGSFFFLPSGVTLPLTGALAGGFLSLPASKWENVHKAIVPAGLLTLGLTFANMRDGNVELQNHTTMLGLGLAGALLFPYALGIAKDSVKQVGNVVIKPAVAGWNCIRSRSRLNNRVEIIEALLDHPNIDASVRNADGKTAADLAHDAQAALSDDSRQLLETIEHTIAARS
jgi:hypothetical protein